jgi:hypothetical protein
MARERVIRAARGLHGRASHLGLPPAIPWGSWMRPSPLVWLLGPALLSGAACLSSRQGPRFCGSVGQNGEPDEPMPVQATQLAGASDDGV